MYFIMTEKTNITVAMTEYKDVAENIAKAFVEPCIVNWAGMSNSINEPNRNLVLKNED